MHRLALPNAEIYYQADFLGSEEAKRLYGEFLDLPWVQRSATYGENKKYKLNRSTCAFGDSGTQPPAIWGDDLVVLPWAPKMHELKARIEEQQRFRFNICLCNYYKSGKQTIGYHADNEERGSVSCIASISLGDARRFLFKANADGHVTELILEPGSLLIMGPGMQENYKHSVPIEPDVGDRINLTFRWFDPARYGLV